MPGGALLHTARGPVGGDRLALEAARDPFLPAVFEETDELSIVHAHDRVERKFPWCDDFAEPHLVYAVEDVHGPHRALEGGHQFTAVKFGSRIA